MKVLDPGHVYELAHLDGEGTSTLTFVKREGEKYPGNVGHHEGVTIQEVLRALLDRMNYVGRQAPDDDHKSHDDNAEVIDRLRKAMWILEVRAARIAGYPLAQALARAEETGPIEQWTACVTCGHVACERVHP